jgi:hypothetical protein
MSGLDLSQLKALVVTPTLQQMGYVIAALGSPWAINQVTGTAVVESDCTYLQQLGGGPALGLFQMEPATHDDCWANYLTYNTALKARMQNIAGQASPSAALMVTNLAYAAAMCRIKYWRSPLKSPAATDAAGCANYHKTVFNSALGAADPIANIPLFQKAIDA